MRVLQEKKVLVTASTPFVVERSLAQSGIRLCTAGRVSRHALASALQTMLQLTSLHPVEPLL